MTDSLVPNPDPGIDFPQPDKPVDFYFPLQRSAPPDNTFEIGLVLGGTVSAAAYTAGVVDFLIQALDAWTVAKVQGDAPAHKVVIKIFAGTSGGALTAVLLARILASSFPHVDASTPAAVRAQNPLYNCWVNEVDITDMLQTTDLTKGQIPSILCADKLDAVGTAMAAYSGPPLGQNGTPLARDYVEPLLPIVLTLTNLRGVPYSTDFRNAGNRKEFYSDYADHIRFKADVTGKKPIGAGDLQPYETGIANTLTATTQPWSTAIHAARGSSAFPVGLPPQVIVRDPQHYRYRYVTISGAEPTDPVQARWLRPSWSYMIPIGASATTPYSFLCVDGGTFNNEPTEFARQWLAGVTGHNARDGNEAHRGVLLVDPFADTPDYGLVKDDGLLSSAGATLSALKNGTRYETADLDLFTADDVYSRFLVNPVRVDDKGQTLTGGAAIATDTIAAFGGFLHPAFREHDFLLGRRNCQRFLQTQFVLPYVEGGPPANNNTLFDSWTPAQRAAYANPAAPGFLPIIPLVKPLDTEIPQPHWPRGALTPDALANIKALIKARVSKLATLEVNSLSLSWPWSWLSGYATSAAGDTAADKAVAAITSALKDADLA